MEEAKWMANEANRMGQALLNELIRPPCQGGSFLDTCPTSQGAAQQF
jgi:hypothetical protein